MTEQRIEDNRDVDDGGISDLRPLVFALQSDDGIAAVYEAVVDYAEGSVDRDTQPASAAAIETQTFAAVPAVVTDVSDVPAYSVTVTAPSPQGNAQAQQELDAFLADIRAQFLLTGPFADDGVSGQVAPPVDLSSEISFEIGIKDPKAVSGNFGVVAILEATVEEEAPGGTAPQTSGVVTSVLAHRDHRYAARGGIKKATVTALGGRGSIRRPALHLLVGGGSQSVRGATVWVHGETRLRYRFVGKFNRVR